MSTTVKIRRRSEKDRLIYLLKKIHEITLDEVGNPKHNLTLIKAITSEFRNVNL